MLKIVIDTNILFRIFKKGSPIRVLSKYLTLYTPAYALFELYEKQDRVIKKLKINESDFSKIFFLLRHIIDFVPETDYTDKIQEAYEIAKNFDPKDTPFIALALKLNIPIWTNDKAMIIHGLKTGKYLALDTSAIEDLIKGRNLNEIREDLKRRYL